MLLDSFKFFYDNALDATIKELEQYKNEEDMWKILPGTLNSGGNLALHLAGNLQYFFGTVLGNTGYVRKRDDEFALKHIPKAEVIKLLNAARQDVNKVLEQLTETDLAKDYPTNERHQGGSTGNQIARLLAHLNYHLGQLNYHRRYFSVS